MKTKIVSTSTAWFVVFGLASLKLVIHLLTAGNYGLFVDELYFLASGQHLAWGYVDMPPMAAFLGWLARLLFGDSVAGIHVIPALAGTGLVLLTGLLVYELGGGWFAQLLAGLSVLIAGVNLTADSYLSMNAVEPLLWMGCVYVLIRLIKTGDLRLWVGFGLLAGLGLMNKHTMLMFGFALIAGLLLTSARKWMVSRWFFLGGLIAFLIFLPNLVWNIKHNFPIFELQANIRLNQRNVSLTPLQFLMEEVIYLHPLTLPVWLAGLVWFFFHPQGNAYRGLGWAFLITLGILLATQGRTYYLAPAFPMLLAGGSVALELVLASPRVLWLRIAYPVLLLLGGVLTMPLFLPVLPPEDYIRYTEKLGMRPPKLETFQELQLPQIFADRFGWPEMAQTTARVFQTLSPEDQAQAIIFGGNYGEAGAIDFYGPGLGLPRAYSGHQNYFYWPPGESQGAVMIALGMHPADLGRIYSRVEALGSVRNPYAMGYQNFTIYLCREPKYSLQEIWSNLKELELKKFLLKIIVPNKFCLLGTISISILLRRDSEGAVGVGVLSQTWACASIRAAHAAALPVG